MAIDAREIGFKFTADTSEAAAQMARFYANDERELRRNLRTSGKLQREAANQQLRNIREQAAAERKARRAQRKAAEELQGELQALIPGYAKVQHGLEAVGLGAGKASIAIAGIEVAAAPLIALTVPLGAVATAFGAVTASAQAARTEMIRLSDESGLAAESLAGISMAAGPAVMDRIAGGMGDFAERVIDASNGTGELAEHWEAAGLQIRDGAGSLKTADVLLREFLDTVQQLPDPLERSAIMSKAFGDAGNELLGALRGRELDQWVAQTREYGYDVTPEAIAATRQWNAVTQTLGETFAKTFDVGRYGHQINNLVRGSIAAFSFLVGAPLANMRGEMVNGFEYAEQAVQQFNRRVRDLSTPIREARESIEDQSLALLGFEPVQRSATSAVDLGTEAQARNESANRINTEAIQAQRKAREELAAAMEAEAKLADALISQQPAVTTDTIGGTDFNIAARGPAADMEEENRRIRDSSAETREALESDMNAAAGVAQIASDAVLRVQTSLDNILQYTANRFGENSDKFKRTAEDIFKAQQGLSIANVWVKAAEASFTAIATLGPIAGGILAAVYAAEATTATMRIASESPRKYHAGGGVVGPANAPDERNATLLAGEGVVSRAGMAALAEVNRGGGMPAQGAQVAVYGARMWDVIGGDVAAMPSSTMARAIRKGSRRIGRRG